MFFTVRIVKHWHRLWSLHPGDIQNCTGHGPGQPVVGPGRPVLYIYMYIKFLSSTCFSTWWCIKFLLCHVICTDINEISAILNAKQKQLHMGYSPSEFLPQLCFSKYGRGNTIFTPFLMLCKLGHLRWRFVDNSTSPKQEYFRSSAHTLWGTILDLVNEDSLLVSSQKCSFHKFSPSDQYFCRNMLS